MTLTLELPPDVESRLHELADWDRKTPEEYALRLLDKMSRSEKAELDAAVAGIRRGMADAAAGREISLEEYVVLTRSAG